MKKKIFITIISIVIILLLVIFIIPQLLNRTSFGLKKSGTLYENWSDFSVSYSEDSEETTGMSKAFLNSITYEITDVDRENMTADIKINIPDISDEIVSIIDSAIKENGDEEYDELSKKIKDDFESMLNSDEIKTETETLTLPIEENDGSYKMVLTEEWDNVWLKYLKELYTDFMKGLMEG